MRVASLVEEVQSSHDRRSALYQSYDDAINKYKSNKDANAFAATRKKVDGDYKTLTQQINDLQTKLKNEGSDLAEKVMSWNQIERFKARWASAIRRLIRDFKTKLFYCLSEVECICVQWGSFY